MKPHKRNKLLGGAIILSLGGFLTKIIGAFYRIPLTNILGAEGIGIYQMVFPLYCLLLTVSSTGVPGGIAKLIAESDGDKNVLYGALKIFVPLGLAGSLIMAVFSYSIALLQGNADAFFSYLAISPSVFLVSIICCYRGYFQGLNNMIPTAVSQIVEQLVKLIVGLTFCFIFKNNTVIAASFAALAVTVSEFGACIYFFFLFRRKKLKLFSFAKTVFPYKTILFTILPIMLSTIIMPLSRTAESFLVINLLGKYAENPTALYGIYAGGVESLVGVPVAVCCSVAVTAVPIISAMNKRGENTNKKITQALLYTLILGLIFALCFVFGAEFAVNFLYKRLTTENKILMIGLTKTASACVLFLPLMQTTASILIAKGHLYFPSISAASGVIIKLILSCILLRYESINVYAVVISDICCYFLASFMNLVYIIFVGKVKNKICFKSFTKAEYNE